MASKVEAQTPLQIPRILCLHGGGTNARIFRAQCRVLEAQLKGKFRLCYAEGPFPSQAGPDVVSVYGEWGPFKRWIRWMPGHPEIDDQTVVEQIKESVYAAMDEDNRRGATGEWVGLLGFSQGAKICASLLFSQQIRAEKWGRVNAGSNFRFAALLAGSAPIISFEPELFMTATFAKASDLSTLPSLDDEMIQRNECLLRLPTIHVHGMRDPGIVRHRNLLKCCAKDSVRVIEWDGDHRVPIKSKDVAALIEQMLIII